jgi:preprotein translocase subunit SecF
MGSLGAALVHRMVLREQRIKVSMSSPSPFKPLILLGAFSGRTYAQLVARYGARYMMFCTIGFALMAAGLWFAAGFMAKVYFADRPLLQGVHIVGEVLQLNVKPYTPKNGYETVVTYRFTAPDGRRVTNTIHRSLHSLPHLQPGGPIDLLYEPSYPDHSTISTQFASDLTQKAIVALLFLLLGFYPALYVYRYRRWRREARDEISATTMPR